MRSRTSHDDSLRIEITFDLGILGGRPRLHSDLDLPYGIATMLLGLELHMMRV